MKLRGGFTSAFKAWLYSLPVALIMPIAIYWSVAAGLSIISGSGIPSILPLVREPLVWLVAILQMDLYFIIGLPIFYAAYSHGQCFIWRWAPGMMVGLALGTAAGLYPFGLYTRGSGGFMDWYPLVIGAMYGGATAFAALIVRPPEANKAVDTSASRPVTFRA